MARQTNPFKITGTIGDIVFYKNQDGWLVRSKGGVSRNRLKNDPAFERARENNSEFSRAGKAVGMFRRVFYGLLQYADSRMTGRLTSALVKVIQSDIIHDRGQRNIHDGNIEMLKGFNFNIRSNLSTTLFIPFQTTINRASGELTISFTSFVAADALKAPAGATHFKIVTEAAAMNFEKNISTYDRKETAFLLCNSNDTVTELQNKIEVDNSYPIFLLLGIVFFQEVNGDMYAMKDGVSHVMELVAVKR